MGRGGRWKTGPRRRAARRGAGLRAALRRMEDVTPCSAPRPRTAARPQAPKSHEYSMPYSDICVAKYTRALTYENFCKVPHLGTKWSCGPAPVWRVMTGHIFRTVPCLVTLRSKYTRALTFQNFSPGCAAAPCAHRRQKWREFLEFARE